MRIALSNFRNYERLELEPRRGLNVFVGPNAQGKSNLLEAIAMLGTGKSFRTIARRRRGALREPNAAIVRRRGPDARGRR